VDTLVTNLTEKLRQLPMPLQANAAADPDTPTAALEATLSPEVPPAPPAPGSVDAPPPYVPPTSCLAPPQADGEIGRLGSYRVLKELGHGGMGAVYLAEDTGLQRQVALKVMLPSALVHVGARERFQREARAMAALKHEHIATVFQVSQDRDVPFLAMELLDGETLHERLRREGRLSVAEVLRIGREAAARLAAAHKRGLIHRDIKPGNLFLEGPGGRVKLLDFGLARELQAEQTPLTQEGAIVGTPAYMAPEQMRGLDLDGRAD